MAEIEYVGTTVKYSLDANGDQVSKGRSRHMEWDFGDRMRSYFTQTGTSKPTVYAHDLYGADGNLVKKLVRKSTGNEEVTVHIDGGFVQCRFSKKAFMVASQFEYLYQTNGSTIVQKMNALHVTPLRDVAVDRWSIIARVRDNALFLPQYRLKVAFCITASAAHLLRYGYRVRAHRDQRLDFIQPITIQSKQNEKRLFVHHQ